MSRWFLSNRAAPCARKYRILVVDDESFVRTFIAEALMPWELFDVERAKTGAEALAKTRAESYDLIILDLLLPDIDGREVYRVMRQERPRCVLAISGDPAIVGAELLAEGFAGFIAKPFNAVDLLEQVASVLGINQPLDPEMPSAK